jgi:hypothetical protein
MERDARRLLAAIYGWQVPPFKLWAELRARELTKTGEAAGVVICFNKQVFDASALELAGAPEFAVRRASGAVERSPHSPHPTEPTLRLVYRRHG